MLFFKRIGKRGAALTEYAILLAFVAAIGASFTASNGLEDSIRGAISKAEKVLAADTNNPGDNGSGSGGSGTEEGGSGDNTGSGSGDNGGSVTPPDPTTPPDTEEPTDPVKQPDSNEPPATGGGNYGFADTDTEDKYKGVVDSLVEYLLEDYGKGLVSASISGKNITIEYLDANGELQTVTKDYEGNKKFTAAGYEVQNAKLSFVNGALDLSNYQDIKLHVKGIDEKDNVWLEMNSEHKFYVK